jgi:mannose-6-phosphate isomerase
MRNRANFDKLPSNSAKPVKLRKQESLAMHVMQFQPILKRIRWGGLRLGTVLNKPLGDGSDYAESWEIVDHGQDQSIVAGGPLDGWTLSRLVEEHAAELLGVHASLSQFPLLVKFLDAQDTLSVQVHPNDQQARRFDPQENGKSEAWVILEAEPGSRLYVGLKEGVDRAQLAAHIAAGTLPKCLHSFPVQPGDCVFVPAGTVHAIGAGILLAEIQQSSDLTFRLYDWGRLGSDGRPRELHIEEALECIDFNRGPVDPVMPRVIADEPHRIEALVRSQHFSIDRHTTTEPFAVTPENRFRILLLLDGRAKLVCDHKPHALQRGQTLLVPAAAPDSRIVPEHDEPITLLEAYLP